MNPTNTTKDIALLLTRADTKAPVLEHGLDWQAFVPNAPPKTRPLSDDAHLRADGADPSDLSMQRWGIVVPKGDRGKRLREIIAPLIKLREDQQGCKAIVYEVEPGMTAEQTWKWLAHDYPNNTHEGGYIHERDRPRYLLALGGPELISWEFQTTAGNDLFIGRLAFPDDAGYEAYSEKVLRHERAQASAARAMFHIVRDNSDAINLGYQHLMHPALRAAHEGVKDGSFATRDIVALHDESKRVSIAQFLAATAAPTPTMLFTISHGLGGRWKSVEEQRRFQGAMHFDYAERLSHEEVENRPFLPGGAWFFFACLSAGTPSTSEYYHWLQHLKEMGDYTRSLDPVLDALPKPGEMPFIARLPQAALANPDGPLSVIGHVDLAWTWSFLDERRNGQGGLEAVSRSSRFDDVFRQMVAGTRIGASCNSLNTVFNNINGELTAVFNQAEKNAADRIAMESYEKKRRMAKLWLTRQDIAAYVTLGDPAARLNVIDRKRIHAPAPPVHADAVIDRAPALGTGQVKKLDSIDRMEHYVVSILAEDTNANRVAAKLDIEREDVSAWVNAYRAAGREALKKL